MRLFLAIALCCSISRADVTIGHGLAGFSLSTAMAKAYGCDNHTSRLIGYAGGILGMIPDIAGFTGNLSGDNWRTYRDWHNPKHGIALLPPVSLHIQVDQLFHKDSGGWEWKRWPVFVTVWVIEAVIAYIVWRWTE